MNSYSFDPIVDSQSKILILGTMPGIKSIQMQEYYALDRNAFWPILFDVFKTSFSTDYTSRKQLLLTNKVALWDTLKFCYREGSLDSAIKNPEANDINGLLKIYPGIKSIIFNGTFAEKYYKKFNTFQTGIQYFRFPSTSPANARLSIQHKIEIWSQLRGIV